MCQSALRCFLVLIVFSWVTDISNAYDCKEPTTSSFHEIQAKARQLGNKYGIEKVLLVFDIDNTLLAMKQDLGSDQWFSWQTSLPETDSQRIGDFNKLLKVQGILYAISSMRPTHSEQPQIIKQLQDSNFATLLLTSRGYNFRDSTRRELLANEYDFRNSTICPREGLAGPYCPYNPQEIEKSGISKQEAEDWLSIKGSTKIKQPNLITYSEGICMTAGQHKGAMLRMLLHKTGNEETFSAIIFVDDQKKHTKAVRDAFVNHKIEVVTFRYAKEDANVCRFEQNCHGEKCMVTQKWRQLELTLNYATVSTLNIPSPQLSKCSLKSN